MKLIKFDLPIDGVKVKNIDELREHFTVEILAYFRNGMLEKWLRSRNLTQELSRVQEIELADDQLIMKILCSIFKIDVDDSIIDMMLNSSNQCAFNTTSTEELFKLNADNKKLKNSNEKLLVNIKKLNSELNHLNNTKVKLDTEITYGIDALYQKIENEVFDAIGLASASNVSDENFIKFIDANRYGHIFLLLNKIIIYLMNYYPSQIHIEKLKNLQKKCLIAANEASDKTKEISSKCEFYSKLK